MAHLSQLKIAQFCPCRCHVLLPVLGLCSSDPCVVYLGRKGVASGPSGISPAVRALEGWWVHKGQRSCPWSCRDWDVPAQGCVSPSALGLGILSWLMFHPRKPPGVEILCSQCEYLLCVSVRTML